MAGKMIAVDANYAASRIAYYLSETIPIFPMYVDQNIKLTKALLLPLLLTTPMLCSVLAKLMFGTNP